MARRRMIYAELFENECFGELSDKAKLLFIACMVNYTGNGALPANEANLRAYAFRYEDISLKEIKEIAEEMRNKMKNFFEYHDVNNRFYISFPRRKK